MLAVGLPPHRPVRRTHNGVLGMLGMDHRKYTRHDSDLPIEVSLGDVVASESLYLNNISEGGLSFTSMQELKPGTQVTMRLPLKRPVFEVHGKVMWCRKVGVQYPVGVQFTDLDADARLLMVEMVCRINDYRLQVNSNEGRGLTAQQAALEWLEHHAADFLAKAPRAAGRQG
jgi:Tfp pilus assembly protein PilZ